MGYLRYLVSVAGVLVICLNLCLAFPMWYGHPIVIGGYRKIGNWWDNGDVDRGLFSGWGSPGPRQIDMESTDTLN